MANIDFNINKYIPVTNERSAVTNQINIPKNTKNDNSTLKIKDLMDTGNAGTPSAKTSLSFIESSKKANFNPVGLLAFDTTVEDIPHNNVIGAYFDKTETHSEPSNAGISGKATLPDIKFDPERNDEKFGRLDIPSVYMGGHAGERELDAGLSWDKVYDNNGNLTYTNQPQGTDGGKAENKFTPISGKFNIVIGYKDGNGKLVAGEDEKGNKSEKNLSEFQKSLMPNYAFRPCWRTTNTEKEQISKSEERIEVPFKNGKVNINGKDFTVSGKGSELTYKDSNGKEHPILKKDNKFFIAKPVWHNPSIFASNNSKDSQNLYFYPGEKIEMSIKSDKDGKVNLSVSSGTKKFSQSFYAKGFGEGNKQSFKAVNSIDQFTVIGQGDKRKRAGLEGLKSEVLPTATKATGASWELSILKTDGKTELLNKKNSKEYRGSDTLPDDFSRNVKGNKKSIDITPNSKSHNEITYIRHAALDALKNQVNDKIVKLFDSKQSGELKKINSELKQLQKDNHVSQNKIDAKLNTIKLMSGIDKDIDEKVDYALSFLKQQNITISSEEIDRIKKDFNKEINESLKTKLNNL